MSDKLFTDVAALMVEAAESLMVPRWRKLGAGDIKTQMGQAPHSRERRGTRELAAPSPQVLILLSRWPAVWGPLHLQAH